MRNSFGGKDHWPYSSALLVGGGIRGNRVLGGTDDRMEGVAVDLATGLPDPTGERLRPDQFLAGILRALDVDHERWLPDAAPRGGLGG